MNSVYMKLSKEKVFELDDADRHVSLVCFYELIVVHAEHIRGGT